MSTQLDLFSDCCLIIRVCRTLFSDIRNSCDLTELFLFVGKVPLKTSKTFKNKFERGQTDVFNIDAKVGEVQKIR